MQAKANENTNRGHNNNGIISHIQALTMVAELVGQLFNSHLLLAMLLSPEVFRWFHLVCKLFLLQPNKLLSTTQNEAHKRFIRKTNNGQKFLKKMKFAVKQGKKKWKPIYKRKTKANRNKSERWKWKHSESIDD